MARVEDKNALDRYLGVVHEVVGKKWGYALADHLVAPDPAASLIVNGIGENHYYEYLEGLFDWIRKTSVSFGRPVRLEVGYPDQKLVCVLGNTNEVSVEGIISLGLLGQVMEQVCFYGKGSEYRRHMEKLLETLGLNWQVHVAGINLPAKGVATVSLPLI